MLSDSTVYAVLAVKDLAAAKEFYEGKLGFKPAGSDDPGGVMYACGNGTKAFVYQSTFAGTNKATAASWEVSDIKAAVEELKGKGIAFENYDIPGATHDGEVHVIGNMKAAWFKDPDGNILNVINS